jgi:hypothetical protein
MANQEHRNVTEMKVDGVIYRETKTLTPVVTLDGEVEQEFVFTRSIGDKSWSERKIISTENEETYLPETTMTWEEVQAFEEDWSKNWNPVDIPTPRVSNNSWMSTFGRLFCWAGLVLVLILVLLLFLFFFWILDMYRSNMWI